MRPALWVRLATAVVVAVLGVALGRGGWRSAPPPPLPLATQAAPPMAPLIPGPTADLEAGAVLPPARVSPDSGRSVQPPRPPTRQGTPAHRPAREFPSRAAERAPAPRPPEAAPPSAPGTPAQLREGGAASGASFAGARGGAGTGTGSAAGLGSGSGNGPGVAGEASRAAGAPPVQGEIAPPHVPLLVPPRVITAEGTEYPVDAFRLTVRRQDLGSALAFNGEEGTVGVRAMVLADGTVAKIEVSVSSGSAALDRAAAEAVRGWRFLPATRDGVPIDAYVTVKIRYVVR